MSISVRGAPLERPPVSYLPLEYLAQASPPDATQIEEIVDPKDEQIEQMQNQIVRLESEIRRLQRIIACMEDPSGVKETLPF